MNRNYDYRLSAWISIRVLSRKFGGSPVPYNEEAYEALRQSTLKEEEIEVNEITVDNKKVGFYKFDNLYLVEAKADAKILVNNDSTISLDKNVYYPTHILYNDKTIEVRKGTVSIEQYNGNECSDIQFPQVKFKLFKDKNDQKEGEITIELIDDPSLEISVYDIFFGEDANEVYFKDSRLDRCRIVYKNKESGRLVIKLNDNVKNINTKGIVHLATNTNQLRRQRNAIETIISHPSLSQKTLLDLCETRRSIAELNPFAFKQRDLDYKILTDITREGTLRQREFVQKAIQTPDFMILQGPPGSGKTTAILELIYQLIKQGKKVLLCASTHVAIDNVLEKIIKHKDAENLLNLINPVRVGDESNVYSECVTPYIYKNIIDKTPEQYREIVNNSFNLVCGTVIGVLSFPPIYKTVEDAKGTSIESLFDYMILDEASKTTFSEFLVPAVLSKRWIIVGDVKQLAPYVEKNDLVPNLLECEPIKNKDTRLALNFLRLYENNKTMIKNRAYILPTSSIMYIDSKVGKNNPLIAISNKKLNNILTISKDDFREKSMRLSVLSSFGNTLLVDSELIHETIPYLSGSTIVLDNEKNISSPCFFETYQKLKFGKNFPPFYDKEYGKYSRKLEDEILWRLIRLYELNDNQGSAKRYSKYIEEVRSLFKKEEDLKAFNDTISLLKNIAIPSIIMMLQEGVNKEYYSRLASGLTEQEKKNRFVMLEYQHRMHPEISQMAREYVYKKAALKDSEKWKSNFDYINNKSRFEIRNIEGSVVDTHNRNESEANAIIDELKQFMEFAEKNPKKDGAKYEIAVLTFYNAQVFFIRNKLQELFKDRVNKFSFNKGNVRVVLNSVDKFQGQEADIVYLSMVQNNRLGFLDSICRLNVAITRAKEKLIIFGDKNYFAGQQDSDLLRNIFKGAK